MKIFATESNGDSSHSVEIIKSRGRTGAGEMTQWVRTLVGQAWGPDIIFQHSCDGE